MGAMLHVEAAIRNDEHIPFSITWTDFDRKNPEARIHHAGSVRDVVARELTLSGSQLVVGCDCFLGAAKLLLWGVLKLWLFEP